MPFPITVAPFSILIIREQQPLLSRLVSRPLLFSVGLSHEHFYHWKVSGIHLALTGYHFPNDYGLGGSSIGEMYNFILAPIGSISSSHDLQPHFSFSHAVSCAILVITEAMIGSGTCTINQDQIENKRK